jgi:tetratricopeptide (TPR) repeat protein
MGLRLAAALALFAAPANAYDLSARISPPAVASVTINRVASPFTASTLSDEEGRFSFKGLESGAYTIAVFEPSRGEARQTIEVGPSNADARGRVVLTIQLKDSDFVFADAMRRRHSVDAGQLAIPPKAMREYEQAQKDLARRDAASAVRRLERAVEIAPQFSAAWNNLGTIAYQSRNFLRAEECFREALAQDPQSYEPLVNLGGVLVTLHKLDEAWDYNLHAVLVRPNDALANSQLGMTYFELGNFELAEKYLLRAREIDPGHFSHPQLLLAEIHVRRGDYRAAAADLEEFLKYHPDWPKAEQMREKIREWR